MDALRTAIAAACESLTAAGLSSVLRVRVPGPALDLFGPSKEVQVEGLRFRRVAVRVGRVLVIANGPAVRVEEAA